MDCASVRPNADVECGFTKSSSETTIKLSLFANPVVVGLRCAFACATTADLVLVTQKKKLDQEEEP